MPMTVTTDVEDLERRVASKTCQTAIAVVQEAVEARAKAAGILPVGQPRVADEARVRAIIASVSALPLLDSRSADEILGYDAGGVPQ
jgi:antitoxin VapB